MKNENLKNKTVLNFKKNKILGLSFKTRTTNYCESGTDATHGTTVKTTTTTGDADAIMIAYITL